MVISDDGVFVLWTWEVPTQPCEECISVCESDVCADEYSEQEHSSDPESDAHSHSTPTSHTVTFKVI